MEHQLAFKPLCLSCGTLLDGATDAGGADGAPNPGDISICLYCGNLAAFADNSLRPLTAEEAEDCTQDAVLQNVVERIKKLHKKRPS